MRVLGHRLQGLGAPYTGQACQLWPCDTLAGVQRVDRLGSPKAKGIGGHGHAFCECGWTGEHRLTGADRRRDHRRHKRAIRERADLTTA